MVRGTLKEEQFHIKLVGDVPTFRVSVSNKNSETWYKISVRKKSIPKACSIRAQIKLQWSNPKVLPLMKKFMYTFDISFGHHKMDCGHLQTLFHFSSSYMYPILFSFLLSFSYNACLIQSITIDSTFTAVYSMPT